MKKADRIRGLEDRVGWLEAANQKYADAVTAAIGATLDTLIACLAEDGLLDMTIDQGLEKIDPDWRDGIRARQWDGQITVTAVARNGTVFVNGERQ